MLQEMKSHPIVPSAEIFRAELEADILAFENLAVEEGEIDAEILDKLPEDSELAAAFEACEEEASNLAHCPAWQEWGEWSECTGCGKTFEVRTRTGCVVNGENTDLKICQAEFKITRYSARCVTGLNVTIVDKFSKID